MRKKYSMPNGVGICLQPLNTILSEKTNSDLLIKTACLTMSGDALSAKEATLSYPMDGILSEDVGCLLGHAESFLSPKGEKYTFLKRF